MEHWSRKLLSSHKPDPAAATADGDKDHARNLRVDRLRYLRHLIQLGAYFVSSDKLARKIIEKHFWKGV